MPQIEELEIIKNTRVIECNLDFDAIKLSAIRLKKKFNININ